MGRGRRAIEERVERRKQARLAQGVAGGPSQFYVAPVGGEPAPDGPKPVDLLHAEARAWADLRGSSELVRFAFEGGDCAGVFDTLIEAVPLSPSALDPASFASQLYLDELVRTCFELKIDGRRIVPDAKVLRRVLETPPANAADCTARQRVLAELVAAPALRADLERLYLAVRRLRESLEAGASAEPNVVQRKIAVLVALQECVNAMADGFAGDGVGDASVLSRLRERGRGIRADVAWTRLTSIVDLEGNVSTVDVRLRLGSDGTIRGFGVLAIRETPNDLLPGTLGRLWQRLVAFLRGYRYGESEVVLRLLDEIFAPLADRVVEILALVGSLELYLAALAFRDTAIAGGRAVSLPEIVEAPALGEPSVERAVEGLFNPLLFLQGVTPKPCDLPASRHDALVVITGPNSGGKTRVLQALALTQLLGQVGLFVPASRARLVRASRIFLSLVTDADAAQVEGRLGTELVRIRTLFEQLEPGAVAILDELCSGTNPMEGEAIFEMVVSLLPRLSPQVFVSTHFLGMAARLARDRPVESLTFLQVELDAEERPTFQLVPGVATTSLAHKLAARLGVTEGKLDALVQAKLDASKRG